MKKGKEILESRAAHVFDGQELDLRPWPEVARLFNARHGTNLTRARIWQIGQRAVRKMRQNWYESGVQK